VKLLFDQNLSPRLVIQLADVFPDSQHVFQLGLDRASDDDIWTYARDHEFIIVTKDADFSELSALRGFPPSLLCDVLCRSGTAGAAQTGNLQAYWGDQSL
jgi:predicted nuclease of predicted toxin-antitoxin system